MKMYILIRMNIPVENAVIAAAHASLAAYLKFQDTPEMKEWVSGTFFKVICMVIDKEFDKAKEFEDHVIITESQLDNQEVAIAFKPRKKWPKPFKFYQLWRW